MNDYPHMVPVDGRPLSGLTHAQSAQAHKVALGVCSRTGTRCFYNVITGKLLFVYGNEPFGGPLMIPFKREDGTPTYSSASIDAMVEYINLGKMPRARKDRIAAQNEINEKKEAETLGQQFREDIRPDVLQHAAFLDRKRRGTASEIVVLSRSPS